MKMQDLWVAIEDRLGVASWSDLWLPSEDEKDSQDLGSFIAPFPMSMLMAILFHLYGWGILLILSSNDALESLMKVFDDDNLKEYKPDRDDLYHELLRLIHTLTPIDDCFREAKYYSLHDAALRAAKTHGLFDPIGDDLIRLGQSDAYKIEVTREMMAEDQRFMSDLESVYARVLCRNALVLSESKSWVLHPASLLRSTFLCDIKLRINATVDKLLSLDQTFGVLWLWFM